MVALVPEGLPATMSVALAADDATRFEDYHHGDVEYRVLTVRRGERTVQAALDLTANHAERTRLAVALLLTGGFGLVLAALAGMALARDAVRPMATALTLQRQFVSDATGCARR